MKPDDFGQDISQPQPAPEPVEYHPPTAQEHIQTLLHVAAGVGEVSTIQLAQALSWAALELLARTGALTQGVAVLQQANAVPKIAIGR